MKTSADKRQLARELQAKVNSLQGFGPLRGPSVPGLSPFDSAFPGGVFPLGTLHEFVSYQPAHAASTCGFISALAGKILKRDGLCLWIGDKTVFPAGLSHFGIEPERIVFVHAIKKREALAVAEEALKCDALTAVVADIPELGFTDSRRLQLAAEKSGVTGFIHRYSPASENSVACASRWKVTPLPSEVMDDLPGIGTIRWDIQLNKVKNGRPASWQIGWDGRFVDLAPQTIIRTLERFVG